MLNVANNPFIVSVNMLSVVLLNVVMLCVMVPHVKLDMELCSRSGVCIIGKVRNSLRMHSFILLNYLSVIAMLSILLASPQCNWGKSAASFCCQVAARVPDMFCNFYF